MPKAMVIPGESSFFGQIWERVLVDMGFKTQISNSLNLQEIQRFNLIVMKGNVDKCISLRQDLEKIAILAVIEDPYAAEEAALLRKAEQRILRKVCALRGTEIAEEPEEPLPQKSLDIIRLLLKNNIGFYYKKHEEECLDPNKMREAILVALALAGQPLLTA